MKRKVHSESEMVKAVQRLERGIDAETIAREHGISKATLYNWKSKYSGMEVSISRACKMMDIHRSYFYYESVKDDTAVEEAIRKASDEKRNRLCQRCSRLWA